MPIVDTLALIDRWHAAVNERDADGLLALCHEDIEVAGPRGTVTGRAVLADWLERAGFSAEPSRWFCGAGGHDAVVEQRATWRLPDGGRSTATVASRFRVRDGLLVAYARHDDLAAALAAARLGEADEVGQS